MIDDLDRCDPEKAVEVLQAINLLLNFDVFVVCLGIDARVISAAVEAHYNELLGPAGATGYEYLEKIVQIPFRIPLASPLEIARFLDSQMPERPRNSDEGERSATSEDREIDPTARYESESAKAPPKSNASGASASPAKGPVVDDAMFDRHEVRSFQELAPFIRRNPRHIKRLVNVYRMVRTLAVRRGAEEILEKPKVTAAWIIVCAQWPYTVRTMLESFDRLVERVEAGEEEYPDTEPLVELHREAKPHISPELQRKIDDDPAGLEKLIDAVTITWSELSRVQPYTLNFNPAIEEALHHSAPDRPPTADG
jgi:hypothetical protein